METLPPKHLRFSFFDPLSDPIHKRTFQEKRLIGFAVVVYLLMVIISVMCLVMKRDALQFHTRDYNYFIEQAARLTDPQMTKRFSMNIEGYNMLGLQGIEGSRSLIQAIHTEYFRYAYVLLYGIFHSTLPIYIFYSLIFFLPLLYVVLIARPQKPNDSKQAIFFILLFVLFPATLTTVTADLRPRMLFIAAWCMVVLSVYYDRPFLEKLVLFGFLIGIREEGIVLGGIVLVLNFLQMQGKTNRWKQTLVFLFLDILVFGLFLAFMAWGQYNRVDVIFDPRNIFSGLLSERLGIVLGGAALLVFSLGFTWWKWRQHFLHILMLLVYGSAILITGIPALKDNAQWYATQSAIAPVSLWDSFVRAITASQTSLVFYIVILLLVLLLDSMQRRARVILSSGLLVLCVISAALTLATIPPQVAKWSQEMPSARLVWQFVDTHDRYHTNVLLDYSTYQAFYNYENILVYNRLPLWLVLPEDRFYPQNKEILVKQIQQRMEYAVISKESLETVRELTRSADVPVTEIASNDQYVILKLR